MQNFPNLQKKQYAQPRFWRCYKTLAILMLKGQKCAQ